MSLLGCVRMRDVMVRAMAGQADEAERLELEAHLADCRSCREQHAALAPVRSLREWEPPSLSSVARERVLREALAAASRPEVARPAARMTVWALAGAIALAAGLATFLTLRPAPPKHLASGEVELDGGGVRLVLQGEAWWRAADHTLVLESGRVHVEVDPARHRLFAVQTAQFQVDVLGTVFEVDLKGVRTERGKVMVSRGGAWVAEVAAGGSWSLPQRTPVAMPAPVEPPPPVAPPPTPVEKSAPAVETHAHHEDPAARLERARRALARGDGAETRTILAPLRQGPRALLAEARLLDAESYLVERRYAQAIAGYRYVLRRFGDTDHGESALYAIAQLEVDSGRTESAELALHRYLDRYPRGRFAEEARSRLAALLRR